MSNFYSTSDRAEQKRLDEIYPLQKIIIFAFLLVLSCVYLPCAVLSFGYQQTPVYFSILAFLLVGASIAFLFVVVRRLFLAIGCTIVIFFLYSYTFSPILPAVAAAIVLIFTLGGFLSSVCTRKLYPLLILLPVVSYIGAYAMTGRWEYSFLAIVPIPAAIAQGILQRKNAERKTIVLSSSLIFLGLLAGVVALLLYLNGRLSFSAIQADISTIRDGLAGYLKDMSVELEDAAMELFSDEEIDLLITQTFNMLPAIITVSTFAVVYLSHSLQLETYKSTDFDLLITQKNTKINMSIYAASAFVLSFILSLSTDVAGYPNMLGIVSGNLCIMLIPGLFIVGIESLPKIIKKLGVFGFFALLLLLVAFLALSTYIFYMVAAIGAFYIIITAIDEWAKKHYSRNQL